MKRTIPDCTCKGSDSFHLFRHNMRHDRFDWLDTTKTKRVVLLLASDHKRVLIKCGNCDKDLLREEP